MAQGLIEPQRDVAAEAPDQRRARHGGQLSHAFDTEPVQGSEFVGSDPQGSDRQGRNGIHGPSGWDDTARSVASDGPGGSRDVSDRRLRGNALSRQSAGQIREELLFAAEEMRYPGNIDPEPSGGSGATTGE